MARTIRLRLGVVALVTAALALTGLGPARQAYQQRELMRQEQIRLQELEERNAELRSRLERLNDPAYREKLAREQLGVVRPGETAYVVVPPPPSDDSAGRPEAAPRGWAARALDWLQQLLRIG